MRSTRVNGPGFAELRPEQLVDLHSLDLSLCPLSPAGLRAIADVKCSLLRIDGRVVNATNLAELQELNVDTLEIGDMPADPASLRRLRQARPDIRVVTYDPSTQKRRRAE